jgi:sporulation protein YabP
METLEGRSVHNISIEGRNTCIITGVKKVLMSDSEEIELLTAQEKLLIKGQGLNIVSLDVPGEMLKFKGRVDAVCYLKPRLLRGFFQNNKA